MLFGSSKDAKIVSTIERQRVRDLTSAAGHRYDTVDLLRGYAILGVILLHVSNYLSISGQTIGASFPKWLQYLVFSEGGNGVSAFFAISGFLITLVSIKRFGSLAGLSLKTFYRIRFARIAPPLLLLLMILSLLHLYGPAEFHIDPRVGSLPHALFAALTFQINWFEAVHGWLPASWTVLWSLSIEEMFYLAFPLLCAALLPRKWGRHFFFAILVFLIGFGPFARTPWYTHNDIWGYQSYLGNLDNVALGCLFGLLAHRLSESSSLLRSRWPLYFQLIGAAMALFIIDWMWPKAIFGWRIKHVLGASGTDVTILGLGTCLVMLGSALKDNRGSRMTLPIRWLGRYSYEVYLSHVLVIIPVFSLYLKFHRGPVAIWVIVTIILCGVLGHYFSVLFSEPMNRRLRGAPLPAQLAE
jgi:peptidoglycan/LPS O-acetylase OafA/YrhL